MITLKTTTGKLIVFFSIIFFILTLSALSFSSNDEQPTGKFVVGLRSAAAKENQEDLANKGGGEEEDQAAIAPPITLNEGNKAAIRAAVKSIIRDTIKEVLQEDKSLLAEAVVSSPNAIASPSSRLTFPPEHTTKDDGAIKPAEGEAGAKETATTASPVLSEDSPSVSPATVVVSPRAASTPRSSNSGGGINKNPSLAMIKKIYNEDYAKKPKDMNDMSFWLAFPFDNTASQINWTDPEGFATYAQECLSHGNHFFFGHSHVGWVSMAFCRLLGDDGPCRSRRVSWKGSKDPAKAGIQPWMEDFAPKNAWGSLKNQISIRRSMDPYLTGKGNVRAKVKGRKADYARDHHYNTIISGTSAWDMIYRNTHPDVVCNRSLEAWKTFTKNFKNATNEPVIGRPNILYVILPYYHPEPTWTSRVPCHKEHRVLAYKDAIEHAAFLYQQWVKDHHPAIPPVDVKVLDAYEWSKSLDPKHDYFDDAQHLNRPRFTEVAMALMSEPSSDLCYRSGLEKSRLEKVKQVFRELVPAGLRDTLHAPRDVSYKWNQDWPDQPSCASHREDTDSWFHTGGWRTFGRMGFKSGFGAFRHDLADFYVRKKYPANEATRCEIVKTLRGEGPRKLYTVKSIFEKDGITGTEAEACMRFAGLDENATSWAEPEPNLSRALRVLKRRVKNKQKNPIPICLCGSSTTLHPSVHKQVLESMSSGGVVTEESIANHCQERLKDCGDFLKEIGTPAPRVGGRNSHRGGGGAGKKTKDGGSTGEAKVEDPDQEEGGEGSPPSIVNAPPAASTNTEASVGETAAPAAEESS